MKRNKCYSLTYNGKIASLFDKTVIYKFKINSNSNASHPLLNGLLQQASTIRMQPLSYSISSSTECHFLLFQLWFPVKTQNSRLRMQRSLCVSTFL